MGTRADTEAASVADASSVEGAEAIVIGTGFGGAVAACRLSQAGFRPLVLERGRRYEASDFPALPTESRFLPDLKRWTWQADQGLWDIQDLGEIFSVQAAGYGGGSLIYANVQLRPPPEFFGEKWPKVYFGGKELERYFDLAAYMLDIAPVSASDRFTGLIKVDQLRKVARHLGRDEADAGRASRGFFLPPLAVNTESQFDPEGRDLGKKNAHGVEQRACMACGACCSGCPHEAKNTLDKNYLAVAEQNGAEVRTQCEVKQIEKLGDGSWQVTYFDHLAAKDRSAKARHVFVCAGVVHTTRLLAGLFDGKRHSLPIGQGYYPNADAMGVVYETEHPAYPSWGPTIATATVYREPRDTAHPTWFMVEDGGYAVELERLFGLLRASTWLGRNRQTNHGEAKIRASSGTPPAPAIEKLPAEWASPSILDALLDARGDGTLEMALPQQLAATLPAFLEEVTRPLLPSIVDDTLEQAIIQKLSSCRYTSWLARYPRLFRWVVDTWKTITYGALDKELLTRHAARAVVRLGGLSRSALAAKLLNLDAVPAKRRVLLLAMGRDQSASVLHVDPKRNTLTADLDLYDQMPLYQKEELLMQDMAKALGGELRVSPTWSFLSKPITVHSQGGCRMSDAVEPDVERNPSARHVGVTDPDGQVLGCPGLYVMDGSLICSPVGVNPSATILALSERNVLKAIQKAKPNWPRGDTTKGALEYQSHVHAAERWRKEADARGYHLTPPAPEPVALESQPLGLAFDERLQGFWSEPSERADFDTERTYRALETQGRPRKSVELDLTVSIANMARFFEDQEHTMQIRGSAKLTFPGETEPRQVDHVSGVLQLFVPRTKRHCLTDEKSLRAFKIVTGRHYTTRPPEDAAANQREERMTYTLSFEDGGARYTLSGFKRIRDDPGFDAWRDTTTLFVSLKSDDAPGRVLSAGVVHVDLSGFVEQLQSMRAVRIPLGAAPKRTKSEPHPEQLAREDPAQVAWMLGAFARYFFITLQKVYLPELDSFLANLLKPRGVR